MKLHEMEIGKIYQLEKNLMNFIRGNNYQSFNL